MHCALVTGEEVGSVHCTVQCIVHWSLVRRRWVEVGGVKCIVRCTVHWSLVGSSRGGWVSATGGSFEPRPKLPVWKTVGGKTRPEIYIISSC